MLLLSLTPLSALTVGILAAGSDRSPDIEFNAHTLDLGANQTCTFADTNRDGRLDIMSGENWYEAPSWKKHSLRELGFSNNYIDNFSDLAVDVDGDGHPDIVSVTWFARDITWWKNPRRTGSLWTEATVDSGSPIEFAIPADIDNDGRGQEVLPQPARGPWAWYEVKDGNWVKHIVSSEKLGMGIGAGYINGDGRTDILTFQGWLEAPLDPRSGDWKLHADWSEGELGFMHVADIDGDGKNDIVTGYAHNYGIFWMQQGEGGK